LENVMGNAAVGVHFAALGALWQAAVVGFGGVRAGVRPSGDDTVADPDHDAVAGAVLCLDPRLAPTWDRLAFPLRWRGARVAVDIAPDSVTLSLNRPTTVALGGLRPVPLAAGRYGARREGDGWGALEEARPGGAG
jgi:trehalose/maltose hydrolase-like predicted phosphorylase